MSERSKFRAVMQQFGHPVRMTLSFVVALAAAALLLDGGGALAADTERRAAPKPPSAAKAARTANPQPKRSSAGVRAASRKRYRNLRAPIAARLAGRSLRKAAPKDPVGPTPNDGQRLVKRVSRFAAVISEDSQNFLHASSTPLFVRDGGRVVETDLELERTADGYRPAAPAVPVDFSSTASDGITLPRGIVVRPVAARQTSPPIAVGRTLLFPNVGIDADMAQTATPTGAEVFWHVRSDRAPETFSLAFDLPRGAELRRVPDVRDAAEVTYHGRRLVSIPPMWAIDADGLPVRVELDLDGDTLTARVKHRDADARYPIVIDPKLDGVLQESFGAESGVANGFGSNPWAQSPDSPYFAWSREPLLRVESGGAPAGSAGWFEVNAPGSARIHRVGLSGITFSGAPNSYFYADLLPQNGRRVWTNDSASYLSVGSNGNYLPLYQPTFYSGGLTFCADYTNGRDDSNGEFCQATFPPAASEVKTFRVGLVANPYAGFSNFSYWKVSGASIMLQDAGAPAKPVVANPPSGWRRSLPALSISSRQDGLGISQFWIRDTLTGTTHYDDYTHGCDTAANAALPPCPTGPVTNSSFERVTRNEVPEGSRSLQARAESVVAMGTDSVAFQALIDRTAPTINTPFVPGNLDAPATLQINANDPNANGTVTSGVGELRTSITGPNGYAPPDQVKNCFSDGCSINGDFLFDPPTPGTYTLTITARDRTFPANSPPPVVRTIKYKLAPNAPTNVTGTAGNAKIDASWSAPTANDGSAVNGYVVKAYLASDPNGEVQGQESTGGATNATITGLTNGTAYVLKVSARNNASYGPASAPSPPITPYTFPGAATNVSCGGGTGQSTVSWTAPSSNGGRPITNYAVKAYLASAPSGAVQRSATTTGATSTTVTGLTDGTGYVFKVTATNLAGPGPESQPSSTCTPAGAPAKPVISSANPGTGRFTVNWTAPANGGSPLTGYLLLVTKKQDGTAVQTKSIAASATSNTVTGVGYGEFRVRLRAINAVGPSPDSDPVDVQTYDTPPELDIDQSFRSPLNEKRTIFVKKALDNESGVDRVEFLLKAPGQTTPVLQDGMTKVCNTSPGASCSFTSRPMPSLTATGLYEITVRAINKSPGPAANNTTELTQTFFSAELHKGDRTKLGLENWFDYDETDAGGDSHVYVNSANGNAVWHTVPMVAPGRGLSTVMNLTYNSQDRGGILGDLLGTNPVLETIGSAVLGEGLNGDLFGASYAEAGRGFSLGISGPTRVNEPLGGVLMAQAVLQTKAALPDSQRMSATELIRGLPLVAESALRISLTDADGTRHEFKRENGKWTSPAGLNMVLKMHMGTEQNPALGTPIRPVLHKWSLIRPDGVVHAFDSLGNLRSTKDRNGNTLTYDYEAYNALADTAQGAAVCNVGNASQDGDPLGIGTYLADGINEFAQLTKLCQLRLKTVTDPAGRKTVLTYTPGNVMGALLDGLPPILSGINGMIGGRPGRIDKVTDHTGRVYDFTYDTKGFLTKFTENAEAPSAQQRVTDFTYEPTTPLLTIGEAEFARGDDRQLRTIEEDRSTEATDTTRRKTTLCYEGYEQPPASSDSVLYDPADGKWCTAARSGTGLGAAEPAEPRRVIAISNRNRRVKRYAYDDEQHTMSVTERAGATTWGLEPKKFVSMHQVDEAGRPVKLTRADDTSTVLDWTADHKVCGITRGLGPADTPGTLTGCKRSGGSNAEVSYSAYTFAPASGAMLTRTDYPDWPSESTARTTELTYNTSDNVADLATIRRPNHTSGEPTWTFGYDAQGNVTSRTDRAGNTASTTYTPAGEVQTETDEVEKVTTYGDWNAIGQPTTVKLPLDPGVTQAERTWKYTYDTRGNLTTATDPGTPPFGSEPRVPGRTTTMTYDAYDRMLTEVTPKDPAIVGSLITRSWRYDRNGVVTSARDGRGEDTTITYSKTDMPEVVDAPGTSAGREKTRYVYDERDRLVATIRPKGFAQRTATSVADNARNICDGGFFSSDSSQYVTHYCLDNADRPIAQFDYGYQYATPAGAPKDSRLIRSTSYAYDRRDNLKGYVDPSRLRLPANYADVKIAAQTPSKRRLSFTYNKVDERLSTVEQPLDGSPRTTSYGYDANGNQTSTKNAREYTSKIAYDHRDMVISTTDALNRLTCTKRRADGLVRAVTRPRGTAAATANCPSADPADDYTHYTTNYTYDALARLKTRSIPYGPLQYGRESEVADWKVTYNRRDALGNPVKITDAAGNAFNNRFYYSGHVKRTERPSWWSVNWGSSEGEPGGGDRFLAKEDMDLRVPIGGPTLSEAGASKQDEGPSLPNGLGKTDLGQLRRADPTALLPKAGVTTFEYDDEMALISVGTALGATARREIAYYANGAIASKTMPDDGASRNTHSYTYDLDGNLSFVSTTNAQDFGGTCSCAALAHDDYGQLWLRQTWGGGDAYGSSQLQKSYYDYDDNGNLRARETPRGSATGAPRAFDDFTFKYGYDSLDQLTSAANPAGDTWEYDYDAVGNRTSEISPRGTNLQPGDGTVADYTTTLVYDKANQLDYEDRRVIDDGNPQALRTNLGYDLDGNRNLIDVGVVGESLSRRISTVYDGRDLPWKLAEGLNSSVTREATEYDPNGNVRRVVSARGTNGDGTPQTIDTGSNEAVATEHATIYSYNADGLPTRTLLPWNSNDTAKYERRVVYDDVGRLRTIFSPYETGRSDVEQRATKTSYEYYESDWIKSSSDAKVTEAPDASPVGSRAVAYDYNSLGDLVSWQTQRANSPDGRRMAFKYYPNGLVAQRIAKKASEADNDPSVRTYQYAYNLNDSLIRVDGFGNSPNDPRIREEKRSTSITRDPAEREIRVNVRSTENPPIAAVANRDTRYDYDAAGNIVKRWTDGALQPPSSPSDSSNAGFGFSGTDRKVTTYTYDSQNREVTQTVDPAVGADRTYRTRWWDSGEMRQRQRLNASGTVSTNDWTYTQRGLLRKREHTAGTQTKAVTYTYDANDNVASSDRGTFQYNGQDQLTKWTNGSKVTDYQLRGDGAQMKTTVTEGGAPKSTTEYCYTKQDCTGSGPNGVGERLFMTVTKHAAAGTTPAYTVKSRYGYDELGSVTRVVHDADGAVLPTGGVNPADAPPVCSESQIAAKANETLYCYDEFGRQVFAKGYGVKINGPNRGAAVARTADFITYDGLDRRDTRTEYTSAGPGAKRHYSYVGSTEKLSRETKGSGKSQMYDYDAHGRRLGQDRIDASTSTATNTFRGYLIDNQGSVVGLEDNDGTVQGEYKYNPYGELETPEGDDNGLDADPTRNADLEQNPFRFQGFYFDSGVKTYDMHARSYRPEAGRFNTEDVFADATGDLALQSDPLTQNRYAFTGGNPTSRVEFDGHAIARPQDGGWVRDGQELRDGTVATDGVTLGQGPAYAQGNSDAAQGNSTRPAPQAQVQPVAAGGAEGPFGATYTEKSWPRAAEALNGMVEAGVFPPAPSNFEQLSEDQRQEYLSVNDAVFEYEGIECLQGNPCAAALTTTSTLGNAAVQGASLIPFNPCRAVVSRICAAAAKRLVSGATKGADDALDLGQRVGIVRDAFQRTGNYGLGRASRNEADELGMDFVGPGFSRSRRDPNILISQDGLRQYRPPSYKPNLGRTQANFERRFEPGGPFNGNGHLDITP